MNNLISTDILAIFANIFEGICNIPLIYTLSKSTIVNESSLTFSILRIFSSILWIIYGFQTKLFLITISNYITLFTSFLIIYYKYKPNNNIIEKYPKESFLNSSST